MTSSRRLWRSPVFHFIVVGVLLFIGDRWWADRQQREESALQNRTVVIDDAQLEQIRGDFQNRYGQPPSPAEEKSLVDLAIDEEMLYREAMNLGLLEDDRSIQWWLIKKMRFVAEDPDLDDESLYQEARRLGLQEDDAVIRRILIQKMRLIAEASEGPIDPSEQEIEAYFEANQEEWRRPDRVSLRHIFLSRDRRGENVDDDAARLLEEIENLGPDAANQRGDPFPLGTNHRARSERQLAKVFGPDFARGVMDLESGKWTGPVPSAYGLHLVFIDEKLPSEDAELATVHNQVRLQLASERRKAALNRQLERMRELYEIQIGSAAGEARANAS